MKEKKTLPVSDAEWYFTHETDEDRLWYEIFFSMCRKFKVSWGQATKNRKPSLRKLPVSTLTAKWQDETDCLSAMSGASLIGLR